MALSHPLLHADEPVRLLSHGSACELPYLAEIRVLLVAGHVLPRESVTAVVQLCGADSRMAASASEAWAILQGWRPNVIITDLGTPGEDCHDLIQRLRTEEAEEANEAEEGERIPAIAVTADASEADRYKALTSGYDLYLTLPIEPQELARAIAIVVKKQ